MAGLALASAQVCRLRAVRVVDCAFETGATAGIITSAVARVNTTPDYEPGEDFYMKNGCGEACAVLKTCDQLKRLNVEIELCLRDVTLLELITGGRLIVSDAEGAPPIGFARRAIGMTCQNPASLELWSKAIDTSGDCGTEGARWWRTVYPKATLTLGGYTMENAVATVTLTGYVEPLPSWGTGPFDDWPDATGLGENEPEAFVLDDIAPPAAVAGYVTVPA